MFELALWVLGTIGFTAGLRHGLIEFRRRRAYRKIREVRGLIATHTIEITPLASDVDQIRARLDRHPTNIELVAAGYRLLGELRLDSMVYRFFVSPNELLLALFDGAEPLSIVVQSMSATDTFVTRPGPQSWLTLPPTHRVQALPTPIGVRETIAEHEKWLSDPKAMTDAPAVLLPWRSLDDVIERTRLQHERVLAWRQNVGDDTLLEMDLRGMLKGDYEKEGERLRRHLTEKPPVARLAPPRSKS